MSLRKEFVRECVSRRRRVSVSELCAEFGISRKTGHKWISRYGEGGEPALEDRSHAPHKIPHRVSGEVAKLILGARIAHETWGPKKIRAILEVERPDIAWPAISTIGEVLKRNGLVKPRRHRSPPEWRTCPPGKTASLSPNDVWTADFKGEFKLSRGPYCYPLTVVDDLSRFLLECRGQVSTTRLLTVRSFEMIFEEYGLPKVIRTDNGIPFAHPNALGRLSRMAVWWMKLGIRPELIRPASPQENGRHERMHRTLKAEATRPPEATFRKQQNRFDEFRQQYNDERPHESLGMKTPASKYEASRRTYPGTRLAPMEYAPNMEVRLVDSIGYFKFHKSKVFLTSSLAGEYVGLEEIDEGRWNVVFGQALLGELDRKLSQITPIMKWRDDRS